MPCPSDWPLAFRDSPSPTFASIMSGSASATTTTLLDSPADTEHTRSTDGNDRPSPAATHTNLVYQPNDFTTAALLSTRSTSERAWCNLDMDFLNSLSSGCSSLSPVSLTSPVKSLYLPDGSAFDSRLSGEPSVPLQWTSPVSPPLAAESVPDCHTPTLLFPVAPPTVPSYALAISSKRRMVDEIDRAARAERKRRRHLAIDIIRRQREATAIQQLKQLIHQYADRRVSDEDNNDESNTDETKDKAKVTVLEQAVRQLAVLQQLVARLTHINNGQTDKLNAVRFQLQRTQNTLTQFDNEKRSHSLYSSAFVSTSLSLILVSVGTGMVLDANARLLQCAGWERHHIIGRLLTVPYKNLMDPRVATDSERQQFRQQRLLVENGEKQMVPARPSQQYKSGQQALKDVICGRREQQWAVWRLYVRSGELCDISGACWAGEPEDVQEDDKERQRYPRPKHIVFALSFSDAVVMD